MASKADAEAMYLDIAITLLVLSFALTMLGTVASAVTVVLTLAGLLALSYAWQVRRRRLRRDKARRRVQYKIYQVTRKFK